jgi:CubicO group peptidase (beta-lactamase class C family)
MGASLCYHLTHAAGAQPLEFVFLIVMLAALIPVTVLYALRVYWSYAVGIPVCLGLLAALGRAALDDTLFVTVSVYSALVILLLATALGVIALSVRIIVRSRPHLRRTGLALLGAAILAAAAYRIASGYADRVSTWNARIVMRRLRQDLAALDTLEERIAFVADQGHLAGASFGIVVDDKLVWTGTYGEGITEETTFNVGSIAKPVVATAVLQLAERGLIDLHADINRYLPFDVRHPGYPDVPITAHVLLLHQSGMAHHTPEYAAYMGRPGYLTWDARTRGRSLYGQIVLPEGDPDYGEFLAGYLPPGGVYHTPEAWLDCRPGTEYRYSSPGFDLLGYLVEQASGSSFDQYLEEQVFEPLGMTRSGRLSADPPFPQAPPTERVHSVLAKADLRPPIYGSGRIGGGGLYSTVPDMAQFLIAHMNEGRIGDVQLLEPESVAEMHQLRIASSVDVGMAGSGYGWTHFRREPWEYWGSFFQFYGAQGHGGSDIGYRARIYMVERDVGGFGVILLTNTANFLKEDMLWYFSTYLQLETMLMEEAERLWTETKTGVVEP